MRLDGLDLEPTVALILTLGYGPARSGLVTTVAVIASVSVRIFSLHHGRILPVWPCAAIDKRGQADQMAPSSVAPTEGPCLFLQPSWIERSANCWTIGPLHFARTCLR